MAQTVVGLFDTAAEAQQAVQTLTNKGFSREDIDVSTAGSQTSNYSSATSSDSHDDRNDSGIVRFFKNLFSDDDDNSEKYAKVASRSGSIVTVHAQTSEQAELAADVLDDSGAVNVDERAATYGYSGTGTSYNPSNTGDLTTSGTSAAGTSYNPSNAGDLTTSGTSTGSDYASSGAGTTGDYATTGAGLAAGTGITNDYSTTGSNTTSDYNTSANLDTTDDSKKIQVIEENLQVGKREVTTGGVRVRSRIVERPVEESLRLREEYVRVERTPVDRVATSDDLSNFQETEIEMTERAEVPVVSKEARVVEEISVGKEVDERTETISDTVRKTEVDVENIDKSDSSRKYSDS